MSLTRSEIVDHAALTVTIRRPPSAWLLFSPHLVLGSFIVSIWLFDFLADVGGWTIALLQAI